MGISRRLRHNLAAIAISFFTFTAHAATPTVVPDPPDVAARAYVLMDYQTGDILVSHNADERLPPASLTKMMTSYVLGNEIKSGNVSPDDLVDVSKNAWAANPKFKGSSLMWIEVGKKVKLSELNKGMIIQSGNDACVAIAEHIAGTEDAFADLMNAYAKQLGMTNSHFMNAHGLPHENHYSSAHDLAILSRALIKNLPDEYQIYDQKEFTYNNIKQYNRNSLLWDKSLDVDGIKTGHTSEAGYSLVASGTQDGMRLISVVIGTKSEQARRDESKKLLTYGFRFYESVTPYQAGAVFAHERVWFGKDENIDLGVLQDISLTIPRGKAQDLQASFELNKRPEAPITKGQKLGQVHLTLDGKDVASYPLVALQDVERGSWFSQMIDHIVLFFSSLFS